jgi:hypothetical protein
MKIKLSIEHNQKVLSINREILDAQIVKIKLPITMIQHHLNEMTVMMIEKIKEELK